MPVSVVNDSQFKFGLVPGRVPPRALTGTFILKGTFKLREGLAAEPLPEDEQTNLNGDAHFGDDPAKSIKSPSDFALFKPMADVLLWGHACAPRGKAVKQMLVAFEVGKFRKELAVFGDRIWKVGLLSSSINDPKSFERMALDWEHALGGANYAKNPLGRGMAPMPVEGVGMVHLAANIENPRHILRSATEKAEPMGFMPIAPDWPPRASKIGTYGAKWLRDHWPWFPDDFDWTYFNAAPADQQIAGFLRGDEKIAIEGMHPDKPRQEFLLPQLRPRWFVREKSKDGKPGALFQVPLQLDTLWVDAQELKVVLTWRGLREIQSLKMLEIVEHFMVREPLSEPEHPIAYYEDLLKRRKTEIENEGEVEEPAEPFVVELPEVADTSWVKPLEENAAAMEKEAAAADAYHAGEVRKLVKAHPPGLRGEKHLIPDLKKPFNLAADQAAIRQSDAMVRQELPKGWASKLPKGGLDDAMKTDAKWSADIDAQVQRAMAKLPKTDEPKPGEAEVPDAGEQVWTRERVVAHAKAGKPFEGEELAGLDLSQLDLSGADFRGAILDGAIFKKCTLAKTRFDEASLEKADFSEAQCPGASFAAADGPDANFSLAVLEGANLEGASFAKAKFGGARLAKARCAQAEFEGADFTQASAEDADFTYASFSQAQAPKAKFGRANMTDTDFDAAKADGADFSACNLTRFRGSSASFVEAKFTLATGESPTFDESVLDRADFSRASLPRAVFTLASLKMAKLEGGNFSEGRFDDAHLEGALCAKANFFKGTFESGWMIGTDFRGANLYGAEFWKSSIDGARMEGADLKGTKLA